MPAFHTKSHREHRVPLSDRAVAILQEARGPWQGPGVSKHTRAFERRPRLLDDWAAYLSTRTDGGGA